MMNDDVSFSVRNFSCEMTFTRNMTGLKVQSSCVGECCSRHIVTKRRQEYYELSSWLFTADKTYIVTPLHVRRLTYEG